MMYDRRVNGNFRKSEEKSKNVLQRWVWGLKNAKIPMRGHNKALAFPKGG